MTKLTWLLKNSRTNSRTLIAPAMVTEKQAKKRVLLLSQVVRLADDYLALLELGSEVELLISNMK
jgi:hypothetical protein